MSRAPLAIAIALGLCGCGGSSGAIDHDPPSTDEAGVVMTLAIPDAGKDHPDGARDANPNAKPDPADAAPEAATSDGASLCDCYGRPLACDEPCADPDAGRSADASGDSEAVNPTTACEASFAREFGSDASPSTCPESIPGDTAPQTVDLCAAGSNASQTICHHVRQPQSVQAAEGCAASCDTTSWGWVSEKAACIFNCWMPAVCGQGGICAPDPGAKPTIANPNPPTHDLICFAESCYASLAPSAI